MKSTNSIDVLRREITTLTDVASIRAQILELLLQSLKARKNSFGEWEKVYFSNAITALTLNIHADKQPSHAWLELCLTDLEKATSPPQSRDPEYRSPDGSVRNAKHEQLMDAVDCLRREINAEALSNTKAA